MKCHSKWSKIFDGTIKSTLMLLNSKGFKMKKIIKERKRECGTIPIDLLVVFFVKMTFKEICNIIDPFKYYILKTK